MLKIYTNILPYRGKFRRAKFSSGKIFIGENFRHLKIFSSLFPDENFPRLFQQVFFKTPLRHSPKERTNFAWGGEKLLGVSFKINFAWGGKIFAWGGLSICLGSVLYSWRKFIKRLISSLNRKFSIPNVLHQPLIQCTLAQKKMKACLRA